MNAVSWTGAWSVVEALGVLLVIWWPVRMLIAGRVERHFEATHPRNTDGIIVGAEPIIVRGVRAGAVLVLHGYNDSPQAVASLATVLHDAGWTVRVPVLPGHARTLQEFARSGAQEWIEAARTEYRGLRDRYQQVAVCGLSMGGALALLLAAEDPECAAAVGIAPYLHLSRPLRVLLWLSPLAAIGARYMSGGGERSIHDPAAARAMVAYRTSTSRLLRELAFVARRASAMLPLVRVPVLIIQSREDNRIRAAATQHAFNRIGSTDKSLEWITGAGHVITVDYGHGAVERQIAAWLKPRLS